MTQSYDVKFSNPLEIHLKELLECENSHNDFPHCGIDRFDLYKNIKSKLNDDYYRDVDSGLTKDSGGSAYTHHDLGHVDDVIRKAGQIVGLGSEANTPAIEHMKPYEVFVLLVACLIHDAGNKTGRKGHAAKARKILGDVSDDRLPQKEISIISNVAKAHGGETLSGGKDTIGELSPKDGVDNTKVRPQMLAAILRLADELAENYRRASTRNEPESIFPNLYCKRISPHVDYESRRLTLDFTLSDKDCKLLEKDEHGVEMYFLDYIANRVSKTELERRYCDRYLRGFATFEETRVKIELLRKAEDWADPIFFTLKENGYPTDKPSEIVTKELIDGERIAARYRAYCKEHQDD